MRRIPYFVDHGSRPFHLTSAYFVLGADGDVLKMTVAPIDVAWNPLMDRERTKLNILLRKWQHYRRNLPISGWQLVSRLKRCHHDPTKNELVVEKHPLPTTIICKKLR